MDDLHKSFDKLLKLQWVYCVVESDKWFFAHDSLAGIKARLYKIETRRRLFGPKEYEYRLVVSKRGRTLINVCDDHMAAELWRLLVDKVRREEADKEERAQRELAAYLNSL